MELTDINREIMKTILNDLSAIIRLSPSEKPIKFVGQSHTCELNKAAAIALVNLAREGLGS